jgi:ABC-type multidrug transport system ATPase subunit
MKVMGGSGSGKTTFLTTLAGRSYYGVQTRETEIYINGKKSSLSNHKDNIGFVPQDDIMLREMTVAETIRFSARTRCGDLTTNEIDQRVDHVIKTLGLEHVRDQFIGDEGMFFIL